MPNDLSSTSSLTLASPKGLNLDPCLYATGVGNVTHVDPIPACAQPHIPCYNITSVYSLYRNTTFGLSLSSGSCDIARLNALFIPSS